MASGRSTEFGQRHPAPTLACIGDIRRACRQRALKVGRRQTHHPHLRQPAQRARQQIAPPLGQQLSDLDNLGGIGLRQMRQDVLLLFRLQHLRLRDVVDRVGAQPGEPGLQALSAFNATGQTHLSVLINGVGRIGAKYGIRIVHVRNRRTARDWRRNFGRLLTNPPKFAPQFLVTPNDHRPVKVCKGPRTCRLSQLPAMRDVAGKRFKRLSGGAEIKAGGLTDSACQQRVGASGIGAAQGIFRRQRQITATFSQGQPCRHQIAVLTTC